MTVPCCMYLPKYNNDQNRFGGKFKSSFTSKITIVTLASCTLLARCTVHLNHVLTELSSPTLNRKKEKKWSSADFALHRESKCNKLTIKNCNSEKKSNLVRHHLPCLTAEQTRAHEYQDTK